MPVVQFKRVRRGGPVTICTKYDDFVAGIDSVVAELGIPQPLPPLSAIGVDYLFEPDVLVEVAAYAVLD